VLDDISECWIVSFDLFSAVINPVTSVDGDDALSDVSVMSSSTASDDAPFIMMSGIPNRVSGEAESNRRRVSLPRVTVANAKSMLVTSVCGWIEQSVRFSISARRERKDMCVTSEDGREYIIEMNDVGWLTSTSQSLVWTPPPITSSGVDSDGPVMLNA
jgi:hypothetical protein